MMSDHNWCGKLYLLLYIYSWIFFSFKLQRHKTPVYEFFARYRVLSCSFLFWFYRWNQRIFIGDHYPLLLRNNWQLRLIMQSWEMIRKNERWVLLGKFKSSQDLQLRNFEITKQSHWTCEHITFTGLRRNVFQFFLPSSMICKNCWKKRALVLGWCFVYGAAVV